MAQETVKVKKVFGDRLLVLPDETKDKTEGGILIPDTAKEIEMIGKVVMVGSLVKEVQPGAKVLYGRQAGAAINVNGKTHLVIREADIVMQVD